MTLTIDIPTLRETWLKLYLNLMMLKSNNPEAKAKLEKMQEKTAEYSEVLQQFFDGMEATE